MPTDLLSVTRERAQDNLFWRYIGVIVDDAGEGWVRLRVPVKDGLRNAAGAPVHGGVLGALVDMAIGGALGTTHDNAGGGVGQTTLDMNVSFLAAAGGGALVSPWALRRRGRTNPIAGGPISGRAGQLA